LTIAALKAGWTSVSARLFFRQACRPFGRARTRGDAPFRLIAKDC